MNILNKVTLKNLQKNKTRTAVTIIGIILSVAMFTAVTTFVSSLQDYLVKFIEKTDGSWYGAVYDCTAEDCEKIKSEDTVENTVTLSNIGYAEIGSVNEDKPYLYVGGMSDNFCDMLNVVMIDGEMPKNANEIILPKHLRTNGGVEYSLGDTLSLALGTRNDEEGKALWQTDWYDSAGEEKTETFNIVQTKKYTIVGFYERPEFEMYSAAGYTALTVADDVFNGSSSIYIKTERMKGIYSILEKDYLDGYRQNVNSDLLRFSGQSNEDNFNRVLYGLAGILIVIIMLGSISLIYNAFSISVSERTKQFGLLKSVGATRRQMMRSVLFEAMFLCCIGIPVGVMAGIGGIGITLNCTKSLFDSMSLASVKLPLTLSVSVVSVIVAAVIGIVTVLISAYIPASRAVRVSPIVAIRQNNDISIKAGKVKTSRLTYKLFGFEGMLASKNFKRNRKKYRATVISLFMSIVLFVSASSFCSYLTNSISAISGTANYDISYTLTPGKEKDKCSVKEMASLFSEIQGITKSAYTYTMLLSDNVSSSMFNKNYLQYIGITEDTVNCGIRLLFVSDKAYEEYLRQNGIYSEKLMSADNPCGVAYDFTKIYDSKDGKYHTFNMLDTASGEVNATTVLNEIDGEYYFSGNTMSEDGSILYEYKNRSGESKFLTEAEANYKINADFGAVCRSLPFCSDIYNSSVISIMYPYSAIKTITGESDESHVTIFYAQSSNPSASADLLTLAFEDKGLDISRLVNYAKMIEAERSMTTIVNIFAYGFITLISLISVANVFNTITTNINLRRREFAMLKSVGMTSRGFNKMMNFECLLYGVKGIVYGIPVSILLTFGIFKAISEGRETTFYLPWYSMVISIGSVFAVVFATMLYSMRKIKKDNPIEALKNENL